MNTTEKITNNINRLPESLQEEVLDFTYFLIQKAERSELKRLSQAQITSMEKLWDNDEDEVWNDVPVR
ncbi:DUF2281 domain-containing protein [Halomonas sp. TRM85114]|uniref:DUF2281 domain-containing protein n=1 Tax=Halomonas jincaotanensis TaxID=2810616 RepID=UPI001BD6757C|nr:DUF2281 domain-containing protein [Halomonas jincaotanensis]MBS9402908.1 DUF2281 domain-containing protein [Halomonas jincaotanensis]